MTELEKRIHATPVVEPDKDDIKALRRINRRNDTSGGITLTEMDALRNEQYNGKISLRVPKTMHRELVSAAKEEGISLNQFILYKLAK